MQLSLILEGEAKFPIFFGSLESQCIKFIAENYYFSFITIHLGKDHVSETTEAYAQLKGRVIIIIYISSFLTQSLVKPSDANVTSAYNTIHCQTTRQSTRAIYYPPWIVHSLLIPYTLSVEENRKFENNN